ncbi:MAG: alpha-2-macroglobulin protein, partial [uncultured bacterium]
DKTADKLILIDPSVSAAVSPSIGEIVRVRLEVSLTTDMEFIYIRDRFASAFEPLRVISGYECKNGEGYYISMRDASANFFIDSLRAGTHTFEYDMRVCRRGRYRCGFARAECMYAPEFGARSESFAFDVK